MVTTRTFIKLIAMVSTCICVSNSFAESLWQDLPTAFAARPLALSEASSSSRSLTLDHEAMASLLLDNTPEGTSARSTNDLSVEIPLANGENVTVTLEATDLLPANLAAKYTSIRTYKIAKATGNILSGRVDFTNQGFHASIKTTNGETFLVDPTAVGNLSSYISYEKSNLTNNESHQCAIAGEHSHSLFSDLQARPVVAARSVASKVIEYKIAVAATAEYTTAQGGSIANALSAIATTLNRVNEIYEDSLGVRLKLVEDNDLLIYTNSAADPYTNYQIEELLEENQSNIDNVIGSGNYDIGHVFGTSGGGLAFISSLCSSSNKAKGASGISSPYGDFYIVDFVAHELGHQFGATHTFNSNQGICTSGARTASTSFEPGSGSTIMSYAGGCGTDDLQSYADAMFHSGNIEQIRLNISTGAASACGVPVSHSNQAPVVSAGSDYTIPANTPFELVATASDADNDILRYSWDQKDAGSASTVDLDTGDNALFRVLPLTTEPNRSFPALSTLLGATTVTGEQLPSTDRLMNLQVSVYDGYNSPSIDKTQLSVINTGDAFELDNQAAAYATGAETQVFWETANTQNSPINCSSVSLYLSTDAGVSFSYLIAESLPNNGAASIYIPNNVPNTLYGRFKLACDNNIFFNISKSSFSLNSDASFVETNTRSSNTPISDIQTSTSGGGSTTPLFFIPTLLLLFYRKLTSVK